MVFAAAADGFRHCLYRAGPVGWPVRRRPPQGTRHAHRQHAQIRGLPDHAGRTASLAGLCHCRHRCRHVFAGQVRHPHRIVAQRETRRRQQLDGRDHRRRHRARRHHWRRAHQSASCRAHPGNRRALRDRHRAQICHCRHHRALPRRRVHQPVHPATADRPQTAQSFAAVYPA